MLRSYNLMLKTLPWSNQRAVCQIPFALLTTMRTFSTTNPHDVRRNLLLFSSSSSSSCFIPCLKQQQVPNNLPQFLLPSSVHRQYAAYSTEGEQKQLTDKEKEKLQKEKEKEKLQKQKEKEKEKLQKQKEKEKLQRQKEKEKLQKQKEKEKQQKLKEKEKQQKEKEKEQVQKQKEKEKQQKEKEKEKEQQLKEKEVAKKEKEKKEKEEKPKKAKTAFLLFSLESRRSIVEKEPNLALPEIMRKIGDNWKQLSAEEKKPFQDRADGERQEYIKKKEEYEKSKPKVYSPYNLFTKEKWDQLKVENPGIQFADAVKKISAEWKALSPEEKQKFSKPAQ